MSKPLSRRDFLKLGGLALTSLAFGPSFPTDEEQDQGLMARVATKEIDLWAEPRDGASIIGKRYRDQLVHIYYALIPPDSPEFYNRLWYRVWGGYLHSAHLQIVQQRLNPVLSSLPKQGQLCELTVPYSQPYVYSPNEGWRAKPVRPVYFETIHWSTAIETGPDGRPWYQITNEISDTEIYYLYAAHLRPISAEEIAPLSPDVDPEKKRIEVSLSEQTMRAYEDGEEVYKARISSGIPSRGESPNGIPTDTPKGNFRIYSKLPSKHMGSVTGNPDAEDAGGYSLPGVPWTSFFSPHGGVAFHGTYWHNNFGLQMSHGCVNMRNADARWLFRWTTPVFDLNKVKNHQDWEKTGNGTRVKIF